jgi:hypothetical protein
LGSERGLLIDVLQFSKRPSWKSIPMDSPRRGRTTGVKHPGIMPNVGQDQL